MTNGQTIEIPLEVLAELNQIIKMQAEQILLLQRIINNEDVRVGSAATLNTSDSFVDFNPNPY